MNKILRCAIYIRVSTFEQEIHGKSLEAQESFLRNYAAEHNMKVVSVFADKGQTARKELRKRKEIFRLLNLVEADEIDIILFWRMDRWFRNVSDFYKVQDILDAHGVRWISTSEPNINMETREGRLNLNLVLTIGQNEVDTTSERIKFVNESSIRQGKLIFGYKNIGFGYRTEVVDGVKRMVFDEETHDIACDIFRYYMEHKLKRQTVLYVQKTYHIDFSYSMLRTMLNSPFYKGWYRDNHHYCPAYLTEDEWNMIQDIQKRNSRTPRSDRVYLFSGLIRCPNCNQRLVATCNMSIINRKTGEKRRYTYYRCNRAGIDNMCTFHKRVSENLVEEFLIKNIIQKYNDICIVCEESMERKKAPAKPYDAEKLKKEQERLNYLFQKDRISLKQYEESYAEIEEKLSSISAPIVSIPVKKLNELGEILQSDFFNIYDSLSQSEKRVFWQDIIHSISVDDMGHVIDFDLL